MTKYYIIFIITVLIFIYSVCRNIYWFFDHSIWDKDAKPCVGAGVRGVDVKEITLSKNNTKFKSTVFFDDGFRFVTCKTHRENKAFSLKYKISVNKLEIINLAIPAHEKAIQKLRKQGKRIYTLEEIADIKKEESKRAATLVPLDNQTIPQGGWKCTCGRVHQGYESSCVCGGTKNGAQ